MKEESRKMEQKPWNRLDRGYRIRKIREWVDTLTYSDDLKEEIRNTLVRAIQRKEITTNACVEYDTTTCRVVGVPALLIVDDGVPDVSPDDEDSNPRTTDTDTTTTDATQTTDTDTDATTTSVTQTQTTPRTTRVILRRPEKKTKRRRKKRATAL